MTSTPCRWSVVIPAFNEERRLPPYLEGVVAYFDGHGESYEVVVVDDGSGALVDDGVFLAMPEASIDLTGAFGAIGGLLPEDRPR